MINKIPAESTLDAEIPSALRMIAQSGRAQNLIALDMQFKPTFYTVKRAGSGDDSQVPSCLFILSLHIDYTYVLNYFPECAHHQASALAWS